MKIYHYRMVLIARNGRQAGLLLVITLISPVWSALADESGFGFAREFYQSGDYFRSLSETERGLFHGQDGPDYEPLQRLRRLNLYRLDDAPGLNVAISDASSFPLRRYAARLSVLGNLRRGLTTPDPAVNQLIGDEYLNALAGFRRDEGLVDAERAAFYSSLLPGSGFLTTCEYDKAFTSFALNAGFLYGAALTALDGNYGLTIFFLFFEIGWYQGGIKATRESARNHNANRIRQATRGLITPCDITKPLSRVEN